MNTWIIANVWRRSRYKATMVAFCNLRRHCLSQGGVFWIIHKAFDSLALSSRTAEESLFCDCLFIFFFKVLTTYAMASGFYRIYPRETSRVDRLPSMLFRYLRSLPSRIFSRRVQDSYSFPSVFCLFVVYFFFNSYFFLIFIFFYFLNFFNFFIFFYLKKKIFLTFFIKNFFF